MASFVDIEKNSDNLVVSNRDISELFDDIVIINKNKITVGGINDLQNLLTKSGVD